MIEPLPHDTFWVIPGQLLAGPYAGDKYGVGAERKLNDLLDLGVTYFVDLTEEHEGLRPYADQLRQIAAVHGVAAEHHREPIVDVSVTTTDHMRLILDRIADAPAIGHVVYIQCWGGVGPTGTVLACHLIETGIQDAEDALTELRRLRRHTNRRDRMSPETHEQREFVRTWAAEHQRNVGDARTADDQAAI
jgi:protein-tyrosine phosphatase